MTTRSIDMTIEQIDSIIVDELQEAVHMAQFQDDKTLFNALLTVLDYYMIPSEFEEFKKYLDIEL